ncbi:MAG: hypothetical protein K6C12_02720 [Oscillospiraceae bacterium]|nr:hypothetical protein [Oscillospiraceae bacterium]
MTELPPISAGFSADGYIVDQDCFSSVRYRTMRGDYNSCGWIAAYNLRHFLGHPVVWEEVLHEMDGMHRLRLPGPTLMRVMRAYLGRYVPDCREADGREAALKLAARSRACIFRYQEERVPHFITCIRLEDGRFRFFNVDDRISDEAEPLDRFAAEHFRHGCVIALAVL